jgi:methionyl-tRNA formyltransferase
MQLRVVFAGTPAFAVPALAALADAQQADTYKVAGVLTQPDRPAGRGRVLTASPVKQAALERNLPVIQPLRLRGDDAALQSTLAQLHQWQPDVMVVVAYGLILPREVLMLPRLGCLNIHASLLPRWRGAAPIQRAIEVGDTETGVAIMQMDEGLDTGDVLAEASVRIGDETTAAQLHDTLAVLGAAELMKVLPLLAAGQITAQPQSKTGVTYAAKLQKSEARVDWHQSAACVDRRIRAFNPWPVAETTLQGEPVKLWRSRLSGGGPAGAAVNAAAPPGTVVGLQGDALAVHCGDGVVQVLELQRAGRKAVSAREFLNAVRPADGAKLVFQ